MFGHFRGGYVSHSWTFVELRPKSINFLLGVRWCLLAHKTFDKDLPCC